MALCFPLESKPLEKRKKRQTNGEERKKKNMLRGKTKPNLPGSI